MTVCGSRLVYEPQHGKEVLYVVPVSSVLGRLPVVCAGDTGTIPFRLALFLSDTVKDFETVPTVTNMTWPGLTPGLGLETGAACTLSMPGPLAGQGICE